MLFGDALFMDSNGYLGELNTGAVKAGTFLGTGVEVTEGPCIDNPGGNDYRVITEKFTVFGVQVDDSWSGGTEPC